MKKEALEKAIRLDSQIKHEKHNIDGYNFWIKRLNNRDADIHVSGVGVRECINSIPGIREFVVDYFLKKIAAAETKIESAEQEMELL